MRTQTRGANSQDGNLGFTYLGLFLLALFLIDGFYTILWKKSCLFFYDREYMYMIQNSKLWKGIPWIGTSFPSLAPSPPTSFSPEATTATSFHWILLETRYADNVFSEDPFNPCVLQSPKSFPSHIVWIYGTLYWSAASCPSPFTGIVFVTKSHFLNWKPRGQILQFVKLNLATVFVLSFQITAFNRWTVAVEAVLMRPTWSLKIDAGRNESESSKKT